MRPAVSRARAVAITLAVALTLTLSLTGAASAEKKPAPQNDLPTQAQVDRAKAAVETKKKNVALLEASLATAMVRMEAASTAAESASENYNGAMWRLSVARKAYATAVAQHKQAERAVEQERTGIVTLVTDSYQNGTELNTATAMLSDEGPKGLMNRYGVVASAGDSMKAQYDAYRQASALARQLTVKAATAQKHQTALADQAKHLAVVAGQAAAAAGVAANQIAVQKQQLMAALAQAEHISVGLATERHDALERIARQKAAAAKRAQEAAEQAALRKAAQQAKRKAAQAEPGKTSTSTFGSSLGDGSGFPAPVAAPLLVANPAPNQAIAVQRGIDYAKLQLGRPYQWAASGPATFDCSGLTMQAWARGGVLLPHYSVAQFDQSTPISMADAKPGDLLFWSNNGSPSGIHHVALYLGGGQFIEAPHTGATVRYNSISNWYPDFVARP